MIHLFLVVITWENGGCNATKTRCCLGNCPPHCPDESVCLRGRRLEFDPEGNPSLRTCHVWSYIFFLHLRAFQVLAACFSWKYKRHGDPRIDFELDASDVHVHKSAGAKIGPCGLARCSALLLVLGGSLFNMCLLLHTGTVRVMCTRLARSSGQDTERSRELREYDFCISLNSPKTCLRSTRVEV